MMIKIAVASGKGGTGKTTVATNLAYVASCTSQRVTYVDCDVEEPNGHLFLNPQVTSTKSVGTPTPRVDADQCNHCGACGDICQFSAIVPIAENVMVFAELCHSCGGCSLVCPTHAITELQNKKGVVQVGKAGQMFFVQGVLNIGQTSSTPVIKAVKNAVTETDVIIIDAPPGTSCPVIESVRDCHYLLLVTEPTPFGLNDLKLAVDMADALKLPFGVIINRADLGDLKTYEFCKQNDIDILVQIPDDRAIAQAYSRGELICTTLPQYQASFELILDKVMSKSPPRYPQKVSGEFSPIDHNRSSRA